MSDVNTLTGEQTDQIVRERNLTHAEYLAYRNHLREEYGTGGLPIHVEAALYRKAWDDGHANGYAEVENHYGELAELVMLAYVTK